MDLLAAWLSKWLSIPLLIYLFFLGISLLGSSLKMLGGSVVTELLSLTSNPFVGLFIGILATSIVQSSSWVTSVTVALVAGGGLDVTQAVPIIMGSNMGTSVTNALVAAGHITRPAEFRRAFAAAVVDDFFEIGCILVVSLAGRLQRPGSERGLSLGAVDRGRRLRWLRRVGDHRRSGRRAAHSTGRGLRTCDAAPSPLHVVLLDTISRENAEAAVHG